MLFAQIPTIMVDSLSHCFILFHSVADEELDQGAKGTTGRSRRRSAQRAQVSAGK